MNRLEKLQEFLSKDPTDSFTRYAIGLEYGSQKNFEKAVETLETLRESDPNYVPIYYQLAGFYKELKRKKEAETTYKLGIAKALETKDLHAASELEAALDELDSEY